MFFGQQQRLQTEQISFTYAWYNNIHLQLQDRKKEHFEALTQVGHASAVADIIQISQVPVTTTSQIKPFRDPSKCEIKETLLIRDLKPALNENVGSENSLP